MAPSVVPKWESGPYVQKLYFIGAPSCRVPLAELVRAARGFMRCWREDIVKVFEFCNRASLVMRNIGRHDEFIVKIVKFSAGRPVCL